MSALPERAWLPHALVRKPDGRLDKPPRCGSTTSNPASWYTLDAALDLLFGSNDVAGVGFAIVHRLIGLDFDNCRNPVTGELTETVQRELERLNSFAYVTPSGLGIRIMGTNSQQAIAGRKSNRYFPGGQKVEIFVGPTNHFNTFTAEIIPGYDTLRDISDEVTDYLTGLPENGYQKPTEQSAPQTAPTQSSDPTRSIEAVLAALRVIPNRNQDWDYWCRVGMAVWRSTGGSTDGYGAWVDWSLLHPCGEEKACLERWQHWFVSPPTKIGFGTLYMLARQANPLFVAPTDGVVTETTQAAEQPGAAASEGPAAPDVFRTIDIAELCAMPPVEWLLDGILTTDGFAVVYGPPGSLKSFLALAWALHVASGTPWLGKPVKQCGVLYVAGEGVRGLGRRIRAWMKQNNMEGVDLPFRLLPASVNLTDPAQVAKLVRTAKEAARVEGCLIGLTFIDTVARAIPGADENSAQDMGRFVAAVEVIKTENGGTVVGIHHSGKDVERGA